MEKIQIMLSQTPGDDAFYERWMTAGHVHIGIGCPNPSEITALVVGFDTIVDDDFLTPYTNLRYVLSPTTGRGHITFKEHPAKVITIAGDPSLRSVTSVSEYVMYQMLRVCNRSGKWGTTLKDKTIGVVGLGRIGMHVAQRASAFGMRVLSTDINSSALHLNTLLVESDFVSLHMNETPENRHFIDKSRLLKMKPTAYFINTARESLVDEDALIECLWDFRIKGAILDVYSPEKYLNQIIPGLTLTNHVAGHTIEDRIATDEILLRRFKSILLGI